MGGIHKPNPNKPLVKSAESIRLGSVANVLSELKRIYKLALAGKMAWSEARGAVQVLRAIRDGVELTDLERKMSAVAKRLKELDEAEQRALGPLDRLMNPVMNNGKPRSDGAPKRQGPRYQ